MGRQPQLKPKETHEDKLIKFEALGVVGCVNHTVALARKLHAAHTHEMNKCEFECSV